jgi:hypothetical protein
MTPYQEIQAEWIRAQKRQKDSELEAMRAFNGLAGHLAKHLEVAEHTVACIASADAVDAENGSVPYGPTVRWDKRGMLRSCLVFAVHTTFYCFDLLFQKDKSTGHSLIMIGKKNYTIEEGWGRMIAAIIELVKDDIETRNELSRKVVIGNIAD